MKRGITPLLKAKRSDLTVTDLSDKAVIEWANLIVVVNEHVKHRLTTERIQYIPQPKPGDGMGIKE